MHRTCALALLACLLGSGTAWADDLPVLRIDGATAKLEDGLQRSADGKLWITLADAKRVFAIHVKRLIPRPPAGKRPVKRREQDAWILCGTTRCATYRGKLLGTTEEPAFDLSQLARTLGLRMRSRSGVLDLRSRDASRASKTARARIGGLVPDLALPCLDGVVRRVRVHPGKRLLLATWAPWSPTRDLLQAWAAHHKQRAGRKVDLWLAAVDVEGASRVKDYVDVGFDVPIALDRGAELARRFPMNDVGHWYFIDELGVLRAEGDKLDAVALQWIDLHLDEPLVAARSPEAAEAPAKATIEQAAKLVAAKPKVAAFAFRLAALHLEAGDAAAALQALDDARRRTPGAWYLRKQYWALWQPNRFYAGAIDTRWISEQKKREKNELDWPRRRR